MRSPNLIVPGFPKSGTSSLHEYLNQHPEICMSDSKEPHIYSKDEYFNRRKDVNFSVSFAQLFSHNTAQYLGESSTSYMISHKAPKRICEDDPNVKFILLCRDPIERIISHYNWLSSHGINVKPFKQELEEWDGKPFDIEAPFGAIGYKNYIEHSLYGEQIERYFNIFDPKQFLILSSNELKHQPLETMNRCFDFLGLERLENMDFAKKNKTEFKDDLVAQQLKKEPIVKGGIVRSFINLIPMSLRIRLKKLLFKGHPNMNNPKEKYMPTQDEISWLKERLKKDVELFQNLSGKKFDDWKYFA